MFFSIERKITIGIIASLLLLILAQKISLNISDKEISNLKEKLENIRIQSKADQDRYNRNIKSYDSAIEDIVKYYDGQKQEVSNFKRGSNETECQAASRLLNNINY